MTRLRLVSETRRTQYGFTLIEMMVSMVVAGIVMGAVYQLLIGQSRSYTKQRELMDVHETLRSAAALLAWEMRQSWAAGGDLYSINANSITLRSTRGGGTICTIHDTQPRFGLRGAGLDDVAATADDSALVYASGGSWLVGSIDQVWADNVSAGLAWCDWGDGASIEPEVVLDVTIADGDWTQEDFDAFCNTINQDVARANCLAEPDWPTACDAFGGQDNQNCEAALAASGGTGGTYEVGAPFRAFRRVEYGLYLDAGDGRWWLGRKVGAAASYEKLTGPLLAPASGGLVLTYRDAAGNVTADPTQVAVIDFVIRAESYRVSGNTQQFQQDTLATRVALRG